MRWRIEKEVVAGIGQFICGAKKCEHKEALASWEVNFSYVEGGVKKNALVKLSEFIAVKVKVVFYSVSIMT